MKDISILTINIISDDTDVNRFIVPCINNIIGKKYKPICINKYVWLSVSYIYDDLHTVVMPYPIGSLNMDIYSFVSNVLRLVYNEYDYKDSIEIFTLNRSIREHETNKSNFTSFCVTALLIAGKGDIADYLKQQIVHDVLEKLIKNESNKSSNSISA